ncbi:MAG: hypothetical protein RQ826_14305 [Xanthomonadales bacterium]|nr:hypothetical protein [Xanthomonadales bacterium]
MIEENGNSGHVDELAVGADVRIIFPELWLTGRCTRTAIPLHSIAAGEPGPQLSSYGNGLSADTAAGLVNWRE